MRWMKLGSFAPTAPLFLLFLLPFTALSTHAESIQIPLDGFVQVLPGYYQYSGQNIPAPIFLNVTDTPSGYPNGPVTFSPSAIHFTTHIVTDPNTNGSGIEYIWSVGIKTALPSPVHPQQPPLGPLKMTYAINNLPPSSSLLCDVSQAGAISLGGGDILSPFPSSGTLTAYPAYYDDDTYVFWDSGFDCSALSPDGSLFAYDVTITSIIYEGSPFDLSVGIPQVSQAGASIGADGLISLAPNVPVQVVVPVTGANFNSPETRSTTVTLQVGSSAPQVQTIQLSDLQATGTLNVPFSISIDPSLAGTKQTITAVVDPGNGLSEKDFSNNSESVQVEVVGKYKLIAYVNGVKVPDSGGTYQAVPSDFLFNQKINTLTLGGAWPSQPMNVQLGCVDAATGDPVSAIRTLWSRTRA